MTSVAFSKAALRVALAASSQRALTAANVARTNLPWWHPEAPAVDPGAKQLAIFSVGLPSVKIAYQWVRDARAHKIRVTQCHCDSDHQARNLLPALKRQLFVAKVGWRLMLVGPEFEVLGLSAIALRAGVVDSEMRVHVTSWVERKIRCVHCTCVFIAEVQAGETVRCNGCGLTLRVHYHVSRYLGAYLAFQSDAQDPH